MTSDKWSRWLHEERWGDHPAPLQAALNAVRDRILVLAALQTGERVVDIGAGTGLLGSRLPDGWDHTAPSFSSISHTTP